MINGTEIPNSTTFSPIEIIIALGTIATAIILGVTLYLQIQDRKPKFVYEKFKEGSIFVIRIIHPDKKIIRLSILVDGNAIPLRDATENTQCTLEEGTGQNFNVPDNVTNDSKVVIKYDNNKLKMKFGDIPFNKYSQK